MWSSVGIKTGGVGNYTWDTPVPVTGTSIVELTIFKRSASAPTTPSGGTYNFSSKTYATLPSGWDSSIPSGTDALYTSRATVSSSTPTATSVAISGWTTPVLSMQNGTNGSDATVNMTNLKATIEANSSTTITIQNSSTLFRTGSGLGGVFIGAGGLYGKNSSGQNTFAIDGANGAASFKGDIETSGKGLFEGTTYAGSGSTVPVALYGKATTTSDVGVLGLIGRTGSSSLTLSGVQGRVADPTTLGSCSLQYAVGVIGQNYSTHATCWAGMFVGSSSGSNGLLISTGSGASETALDVSNGAIKLSSAVSSSFITLPYFTTGITGHTTILNSTGTANCFEVRGSLPVIKLYRENTINKYFSIHNEASATAGASNMVFRFNGGASNLFVFSEAGAFTALDNITAYSDRKIKENIEPLEHPLEKLKRLGGYQYKNRLANKNDCGIIAQEVEKILPQLVQTGSTEFDGVKLKTVNYNGIVALLVAAVNELQAKVERLEHDTTK
jgi:hypothetical protein